MEYDVDSSITYLVLYIDDNFPSDFYYGFGDPSYASNPGIGGKVFVTEGMPGMNFDETNNNSPLVRRITSFTDQNGFYSISGLEPGLYNVSVYMEDHNLQESTFRPESNSTHVSETICCWHTYSYNGIRSGGRCKIFHDLGVESSLIARRMIPWMKISWKENLGRVVPVLNLAHNRYYPGFENLGQGPR